MRTHNYDFLTIKENGEVNYLIKKWGGLFKRGLITKGEADFSFQKDIMEKFPKQAFDICTNRDDFKK